MNLATDLFSFHMIVREIVRENNELVDAVGALAAERLRADRLAVRLRQISPLEPGMRFFFFE